MAEPGFFSPYRLTIAELAALVGATVPAGCDPAFAVSNIAALDRSGPDDLVFLDKARHADGFASARARVCLTTAALAGLAPSAMTVLAVAEPYRAFVEAARALFPDALRPRPVAPWLTASAVVDPSARLEHDVTVEAHAVVGAGAEIGSGTVLGPGAVIGPGVRIGRDCAVGASATIIHALIGDRVTIHAGARIGQDGFGYLPGRSHRKIPQVGRVIIQNDVEIGANSTIDRGGLRDTVIGEGTKIDNLVQIGHNVRVGRHCIIVSQVGLSGSVTLGDYVVVGGQVGIADHATIGDGAQVAARAGVMGSLAAGGRYSGAPAVPQKDHFRQVLTLQELARRKAPAREKDEG